MIGLIWRCLAPKFEEFGVTNGGMRCLRYYKLLFAKYFNKLV
uniref:Uncharacterized protein n=1 Tax=Arundo donax TaxID=35708 RepID=A0A0A9DZH5_ARUDO